jgi:hypothetical protein
LSHTPHTTHTTHKEISFLEKITVTNAAGAAHQENFDDDFDLNILPAV